MPGNIIYRNAPTSQNTRIRRPSVVINKQPERQTFFLRLPVVPVTKLSIEASLSLKGQRNNLMFTDNIAKVIRIWELNGLITNCKAEMASIPGAASKICTI